VNRGFQQRDERASKNSEHQKSQALNESGIKRLQGDKLTVRGWKTIAPVALLGFGLVLASGTPAQQQQAPVPDAPTPQAPPPLPGVSGGIAPGTGAGETPSTPDSGSTAGAPDQPPAPRSQPPAQQPANDQPPPNAQDAPPAQSLTAAPNIVVNVNFVQVPVTVKDSKGNLVSGLTWRDFTVYENNTREPLRVFSVDPQPLSIAFVIDQTVPSNVMAEVNNSMGSIQGALAPYDEAAVFTYTNGPKEWTGFTAAQGGRLPAVLSMAQSAGTDPMVPVTGGDPFSACAISINGNCPSPTLQPGGSTQTIGQYNLPKEIHTLNDAILAAAKELSTRPKDRRRIIFVISDGKEYGSKATWKEVVKYLQTNKIAVYGTLVGDTGHWGGEWVDRIHIPLTGVYDNILYRYTAETGGDYYAEGGTNGIERSYAKIAEEARDQYTLGYLSHQSTYDDRFRPIEVRVDRPNLTVINKRGYYPSAQDHK
jgi:VWFA-related protein